MAQPLPAPEAEQHPLRLGPHQAHRPVREVDEVAPLDPLLQRRRYAYFLTQRGRERLHPAVETGEIGLGAGGVLHGAGHGSLFMPEFGGGNTGLKKKTRA